MTMARNINVVNIETLTENIYFKCDILGTGLVPASSLIKFIEQASNKNDNDFHQKLLSHFDKSGQDSLLDYKTFQELMTLFIDFLQSCKSPTTNGENYNEFLYAIASPNASLLSQSDTSLDDRLEKSETEDIQEKLHHYKSISSTLASEKSKMLNKLNEADDEVIELQAENMALRETAESLRKTMDLLKSKTKELSELNAQVTQYQHQWHESEGNTNRLEAMNQKLKSEVDELKDRVNFILTDSETIDDINCNLKTQIKELNEKLLNYEQTLNLYEEKNNEYKEELNRYNNLSQNMEDRNKELQLKLQETEERLRDKEIQLSSFILQSSFDSIDDDHIPIKAMDHTLQKSFKDKPSLFQEIQSSLNRSPVFPQSVRDLELQKILASGSAMKNGRNEDDSNTEPEIQTYFHSSFLETKKLIYIEELIGLIDVTDKWIIDKKIDSLGEEYINIIQAKMSADVNCTNLKNEILQLQQQNECLQREISDLKNATQSSIDKLEKAEIPSAFTNIQMQRSDIKQECESTDNTRIDENASGTTLPTSKLDCRLKTCEANPSDRMKDTNIEFIHISTKTYFLGVFIIFVVLIMSCAFLRQESFSILSEVIPHLELERIARPPS